MEDRAMYKVKAMIDEMDEPSKLTLRFIVKRIKKEGASKPFIERSEIKGAVKDLLLQTSPDERREILDSILALTKSERQAAVILHNLHKQNKAAGPNGGRSRRKSKRRKQTKRR